MISWAVQIDYGLVCRCAHEFMSWLNCHCIRIRLDGTAQIRFYDQHQAGQLEPSFMASRYCQVVRWGSDISFATKGAIEKVTTAHRGPYYATRVLDENVGCC